MSEAPGDTLYAPAVVGLPGGNLVAAWTSSGKDGSGKGVVYRVFNSQGAPLGATKVANSHTAGHQQEVDIAATANGGFVVVWRGDGPEDDSGGGVYARLFNALGTAVGNQFVVNSYTFASQSSPAVTLAGQKTPMVWYSMAQDGASGSVVGQLFDVAGAPAVQEFIVNGVTDNNQKSPAVAGNGNGFAAVWMSNNQDGSGWGVFMRKFNTSGQSLGADIQVNSTSAGDQVLPDVAATGAAGYAAVWVVEENNACQIKGQRFEEDGTKEGDEFAVSVAPMDGDVRPRVSGLADGGFMAVWSADVVGDQSSVLGLRFDAQGTMVYK